MANKGTQALLVSDVSLVKEITKGNAIFSVSTTNIEGVNRLSGLLNLSLKAAVHPMVDIPYEKADSEAKKLGFSRNSLRYEAFAGFCLFYMFVQIFLSAVSATLARLGLKAFYRSESLAQMKACDAVVSCSDENFKESSSMLRVNVYWIAAWWSMLVGRVVEVLVAKSLGKPVVMFPNSIGPFQTVIGRSLSKLALNNCDLVLVREPISYDIVKSLRIRAPIVLTSDTTLTFNGFHDSAFPRKNGFNVGVSPGVYSHSLSKKEIYDYILAHAKALDLAIEKYGFSVVFMPHYISGFGYDDLEMCKQIQIRMKKADRTEIVDVESVEKFKMLISGVDMVVSSKMHPAVLAASAYVPSVCVAYDHKQTGFFMNLGMEECVIPINEVSCETLLSKLDYVWNNRERLAASLEKRVPELRNHVKKSVARAIEPFVEKL
jgi:polysaccharide pyruvyl transferase WcaK-like protein